MRANSLAARRDADPFAVPLDQSGLKEALEFLDLPAVLALLDGIAVGGFRDAARRADLHEALANHLERTGQPA
jgi:hypothetical protein